MEEVVGGSRGKGVVAGLEFSGKVSIIQKVTIALSFEGGGGGIWGKSLPAKETA